MILVGIVSQSRIIDFIYKYRDHLEPGLKEILRQSVESWIPLHKTQVYTIHMNDSVYNAFNRIWELQVSGTKFQS